MTRNKTCCIFVLSLLTVGLLFFLPAGCTQAPPTPPPAPAPAPAPATSSGQATNPNPVDLALESLQGFWQGQGPPGAVSITIEGDTLHYVAPADEWWATTFTLPPAPAPAPAPGNAPDADIDPRHPRQLHATITGSSSGTRSNGDVVKAIYKIEDGTLTLATAGDTPPASFAEAESRYILTKGPPQDKSKEATTP